MRKTIKKVIASIVALTTLAMGTTVLSVGAYEPLRDPTVSTYFSVGPYYTGLAELYASSTQANATTSLNNASYVRASLTVYGGTISSYSANNGIKVSGSYVSVNCVGSGFTRAEATYYAEKGGYNGSTYMSKNIY